MAFPFFEDNGRELRRRTDNSTKRMSIGIFFVAACGFIFLTGCAIKLMATKGERFSRQVLSQAQASYSAATLPFKRGDILDCNGTVLATSQKVYNVILDCKVVNTKEAYAEPTEEALYRFFGIKKSVVEEKLTDEKTKESQYQVLVKGISVEEKQAFDDYLDTQDKDLSDEEKAYRKKIKGVWFEEDYERRYPLGSLACDVIGFAYGSSTADYGLEGYYNNTLSGTNGRKFGYWDADETYQLERIIIEPEDGSSLVTTLDANIQKICDDEIAAFTETFKEGPTKYEGAKNIGIIVMDPDDGSILAMASNNAYDLNDPRDLSAYYTDSELDAMTDEQQLTAMQELWRNFCIFDTYEPGSTFKPVTVSAALESGTLVDSDIFICDGGEEVEGVTIHCSELQGHGKETLRDVIKNSCNDAIMQIASGLGISRFCEYQRSFNFGSKTGIDLSGESAGILYNESTMTKIDLATASFGQGFNCTMIQEAAAVASIVNGGDYYRPHIVEKITASDGSVKSAAEGTLMGQTVSLDTSEKVKSYMRAAVEDGTAGYATLDGYTSGGKTGTAEKLPRGQHNYLVSYVGFAPYDDPEILVYVVVDEPNVADQDDNRLALWLARNVMTDTLDYLAVPCDREKDSDNILYRMNYDNFTGEATTDTAEGDVLNAAPGVGEEPDTAEGNTREEEGFTNEEAGLA